MKVAHIRSFFTSMDGKINNLYYLDNFKGLIKKNLSDFSLNCWYRPHHRKFLNAATNVSLRIQEFALFLSNFSMVKGQKVIVLPCPEKTKTSK